MGSPKTREIAGLVWTWKPDYEAWTTETGLYVIRYDAPPGFDGGTEYLAPGPDQMFDKLSDACEAEVRWAAEHDAEAPTVTPANDTAIEDGPVAQSASPTLDPGEIDRMIGEEEHEAAALVEEALGHAESDLSAKNAEVAVGTSAYLAQVAEINAMTNALIAARLDEVNAEREAQRRDLRAYYRNVAGWAVAVLVLVALCSGVVRG